VIENYNGDYKDCFAKITGDGGLTADPSAELSTLTNYIETLLKSYLHTKVCICIKIIEAENNNISEWKVKTIARSLNTPRSRKEKDGIAISVYKNSDLNTIITKNASPEEYHGKKIEAFTPEGFLAPNISALAEAWKKVGLEYSNTTEEWEDDYSSTIVVPIRIASGHASEKIKKKRSKDPTARYHIIGFLCLDSKDTFENDIEIFTSASKLLKSFADSLYPMIEKHIEAQFISVG